MFDRYRTLVEVVDRGSLSAASRALGLSQPALTRQIQQLEAEYGAQLLARSARGVRPTEPGRLVVAEARAMLERHERLKEGVRAQLGLERGTVRLGAGATAVSAILPEVIRDFGKKHPGLVFQVKEAGSRQIEEDVLAERIELGIVTLPVRSRDVLSVPIAEDEIVLTAARNHALARRREITPRDLNGADVIGFESGSAIRRTIDRALERQGVAVRVVMELRSLQSILRMVGLGLGLGFVSRLGITPRDRGVRAIAVKGLRIRRTLAVITKRDHPLSPAAGAFADALKLAPASIIGPQ